MLRIFTRSFTLKRTGLREKPVQVSSGRVWSVGHWEVPLSVWEGNCHLTNVESPGKEGLRKG